jgi:hypothetical protein
MLMYAPLPYGCKATVWAVCETPLISLTTASSRIPTILRVGLQTGDTYVVDASLTVNSSHTMPATHKTCQDMLMSRTGQTAQSAPSQKQYCHTRYVVQIPLVSAPLPAHT